MEHCSGKEKALPRFRPDFAVILARIWPGFVAISAGLSRFPAKLRPQIDDVAGGGEAGQRMRERD
jgi:hypothetical protein